MDVPEIYASGHDDLPDRFPRSGKKQNLSVLRAFVVQY